MSYLSILCQTTPTPLQELSSYLSPHPLKAKAAGKQVVMVPLILFSDDTSGNKSKKWHKFECWYLSLAGLPRHQNARLDNIHFVSCSDSVSALDLSFPIAKELTKLECEGMVAFDALYQEEVLVVAPLMCIVLLQSKGFTTCESSRKYGIVTLPHLHCKFEARFNNFI